MSLFQNWEILDRNPNFLFLEDLVRPPANFCMNSRWSWVAAASLTGDQLAEVLTRPASLVPHPSPAPEA